MHPTASWSSRLVLALLALQLASACDPNPPPPPPAPDTAPPSTRATPNGGTFKTNVSVTLLCEDGTGSGCDATYYTTDGSAPSASSTRYSAPVVLSQNTTLKFFSVDKSGNAESVQSQSFVVDTAAPTTTATPPGSIYNSAQSVVLTCDDGTGTGCAATYFTTDGSEPTASSPRYTAALALSTNTTLKYFSVDTAGNAETVNTSTYVIDTVAPTTTATPAAGTYDEAQSVTLACNDGTGTGCSATHYTLDGSTPTTSSPSYSAPISITAHTTLKFFSVDGLGNTESVQTAAYVINSSIPTVSASPAGGSYRTAQSVTLSCDPGATGGTCEAIYYTTDGSTPGTGSATYSAPITVEVTTTLKFFAKNSVGNSSTLRTETYRIDKAAPTTTAIPSGRAYHEAQSVTLLCEDGSGSGCTATYYTLDGSTPTRDSSTYSAALSISADTTLKFFSVDAAGNEEPVRTETYVIDTVKPTVAATPAGGLYRSAQDITLTCTDNSGGSGCDSIHYTTDGSLPTTGAPVYTALRLSTNTALKFVAVDKVGNVSAVQTELYTFDAEAPTTTVAPTGGTYRTRQPITLTCADSGPSGCEDTYYTLDGSTPTTSSTRYTGSFTLSSNTTLKFFSVDKAGNEEAVQTETYFIDPDETAPTTSASPEGGSYLSAVSVFLSCTDDTGGTGCEDTYYTLDGSTPTTSSARYTGPITLSATATLKFFSVDTAGNAESTRTERYAFPTAASTSAQIATVRARPDGTIDEFIDYALVTYTKPTTGASDPAGFFLQEEKDGPAVFFPYDPSWLDIHAGNRVDIHVTDKRTVNGLVQITGFRRLTLYSTADPVDFLVNDVSGIDLVANLNNYESELISITGSVASTFTGAGTGHVSANLVTLGNSFNPNLKLRLTTAVQDAFDVTPDCVVATQAPLWRFTTQAQPSAWAARDLTVLSCPGPKATSATATSETSVTVNFDRKLDPASVLADGSQFAIDEGLVVTAATVTASQRQVQLTTSAQVPGTLYRVVVASSVKDTRATSVEPSGNTATFTGFIVPAVLRISEVAPGITGGKDLVELLVVKGGSVDKFTLVQGASLILATFPNVLVSTGDIIVVHLRPATAPIDAPNHETTSKSEFAQSTYGANYDSAWDFIGTTTEIGYSQRVLRVRDGTGATQDGTPFYRSPGTGSVTADFYTQLQALQDEGQWLPSNCGGVPCTDTSTPRALEVSADWNSLPTHKGTTVRRISETDTNTRGDWAVGASSFGVPNP
ncbi:chitobiase/beta-hexosaminidase-like protein [Archangium gephyra]|uniref:Beta-hexosaminidase n=1 Tax=Archangium gephyra TaxID=48 RepID=A0AAC8QHB4_9BACT|nr:chitobiase/beta-hexosaminidase C-terminal domain-containing protein [Archangium gephyra]AKJ07454.1 Beta-hexosaminidase [Archangium gephyra]REG26848.1 chitobiase/beta-hexosaminidase-like protein [Archangium gephyra]